MKHRVEDFSADRDLGYILSGPTRLKRAVMNSIISTLDVTALPALL
jgi:hypothetical protein